MLALAHQPHTQLILVWMFLITFYRFYLLLDAQDSYLVLHRNLLSKMHDDNLICAEHVANHPSQVGPLRIGIAIQGYEGGLLIFRFRVHVKLE